MVTAPGLNTAEHGLHKRVGKGTKRGRKRRDVGDRKNNQRQGASLPDGATTVKKLEVKKKTNDGRE